MRGLRLFDFTTIVSFVLFILFFVLVSLQGVSEHCIYSFCLHAIFPISLCGVISIDMVLFSPCVYYRGLLAKQIT